MSALHHSRIERAGKIVASIKKATEAIEKLDKPGRPAAAGVRTSGGTYIECPSVAGILSIQATVRRELVDQIAALKREAAQINLSLEGL